MSSIVRICNYTNISDFEKEWKKSFVDMLAKVINEHIIPNFGKNLKFDMNMGLHTSDEYGSYKIEFFDKNDKSVCYILADTILGKWEIFKS